MDFSKMSNEDLLNIIKSPENDWQGTLNEDSIYKFQGRQCFVYAAAMILFGRELETGREILTTEQAANIFFNIARNLLDTSSIDGESGNSRFCPETMLNLWKVKFSSRNIPISA